MTYQPPPDPYQQNPYSPGQYPPPNPTPPAPGHNGGWPDPYQQPDPYGPPTSGPGYGQPTSGPGYGQPGGYPPPGPGGPGMPPPGGGFGPGAPQPPKNNGPIIGIVIGAVVLVLAGVVIGGYFLLRDSGSDSADGGDTSASAQESPSDSPEPTTDDLPSETTGGSGGFADTAQTGDCLDYPSDPNDTKIVDCSDSSAHYEVLKRVDEPTTTENTNDAAASQCEGTGFDSTLYVLGASASNPFVLCLKTL